jgi:hypothetical protein
MLSSYSVHEELNIRVLSGPHCDQLNATARRGSQVVLSGHVFSSELYLILIISGGNIEVALINEKSDDRDMIRCTQQ